MEKDEKKGENLHGRSADVVAEEIEVVIRRDGKVLWVNDERGCILRVGNLKELNLIDERPMTALSKQDALELFKWLDYEYNITEGYDTLSELRKSERIAEKKFADALSVLGLDLDDLRKICCERI